MYDVWTDLGSTQPTGVGLYVMSGSTGMHDTYFVLGDADTTSNNGAIFFYARGDGELVVHTDSQAYPLGSYTTGTWYDLEFTVDWACKAFDVWVDGSLRQYNLPFRNTSVDEFSQLHVFNFHNSTGWWDQIVFSGPPPSPQIFADDFERASPCRWSAVVP